MPLIILLYFLLTETRHQLQQSDKEIHAENTPLRTINVH